MARMAESLLPSASIFFAIMVLLLSDLSCVLFYLRSASSYISPLGLIPADAGVGDTLAVNSAVGLLVAVLDVGLDHKSLDQVQDIVRVARAVKDLLCNARLLVPLLAGV